MRPATTLAALTAGAAAVLFAVAGPGAGSEDIAPAQASDRGARHQLLGSWKTGRSGKLVLEQRRGRVNGRVTRTVRLAGCRVPAGTRLLRSLRFVRREAETDVWAGRLALPDRARDCRRRTVSVRVRIGDDLRLRALYRNRKTRETLRLRRIRPKVRNNDPVIGVWERRGVGFRVVRRGRLYYGIARDAYLISNNCTVPAGTTVWRLRPAAPGRYDGTVHTFLPPPDCSPTTPAPSRWLLEGGRKLFREAPDGSRSEYKRASARD